MVNLEKLKANKSTQELLEFGIINIDKPSGPTSFNVSDFVRKKLNLRKTSHFGTLDPKVTGVLPIALNRACKLTGFFLGEDKVYVGIMRFHEPINRKDVEKIIKDKFIGKITQLPPVKSRVARKLRQREIKSFKILEQDSQDFLFEVECEGGTYIRKLVDDLGKELGIGAHMLELRRTRAGIFKEYDKKYPPINLYEFERLSQVLSTPPESQSKAVKDEKLLRKIIIPAEIISQVYPIIEVKKESVDRILHGSPIYDKFLKKKINVEKDKIACVFCEEKFVGMFKIINQGDIFAKSEFTMQEMK